MSILAAETLEFIPLPVSIRNVTKRYGDFVALDDISIEIPAGTVTSLIGPSGSGKSTLLRTVNGLELFQRGEVLVGGSVLQPVAEEGRLSTGRRTVPKELAELRKDVGVVFQQYNLFPHKTVLQNVTEAQRIVLGRSAAFAKEIALHNLAKVGLANKVDSYPKHLSGGQQQRVAIARALAMNPSVLLLDEVTSALDPELSYEVLRVIKALADEGLTLIVVTHEMHFARAISDQVVVLDHGRIVERGSAVAVFDDPQSARTRAFLTLFE